jgi:hypothetical protein
MSTERSTKTTVKKSSGPKHVKDRTSPQKSSPSHAKDKKTPDPGPMKRK